jgi:hypothetical protein
VAKPSVIGRESALLSHKRKFIGGLDRYRKRASYHNEAHFYRACANQIAHFGVPRCHFVKEEGDNFTLILEDMSVKYPK